MVIYVRSSSACCEYIYIYHWLIKKWTLANSRAKYSEAGNSNRDKG